MLNLGNRTTSHALHCIAKQDWHTTTSTMGKSTTYPAPPTTCPTHSFQSTYIHLQCIDQVLVPVNTNLVVLECHQDYNNTSNNTSHHYTPHTTHHITTHHTSHHYTPHTTSLHTTHITSLHTTHQFTSYHYHHITTHQHCNNLRNKHCPSLHLPYPLAVGPTHLP